MNKKKKLIVDKEIKSKNEDLIGVKQHVNSIKQAIKDGAEIVCISSKYGEGKSSVCNLLLKDIMFSKKSKVSLWDVTIDKQMTISKCGVDLLQLYKSFLCQLSADFHGNNYSNYINKALNKTTTFFNIYFKSKFVWFFNLILFFLIGIYCVSLGIEFSWVFDKIKDVPITIDQTLVKNVASFLMIIPLTFLVLKGKVLYTSWKTERERLITNDDVTSLYVDLINDSLKFPHSYLFGRKSIVIIEDLDRCIDDTPVEYENVLDFLKSIIKLRHYKCRNIFLKRKLESIVFVIALDEEALYKIDNPKVHNQILKLFDYRLDLGKIHNEDYGNLLDNLLYDVDLPSSFEKNRFKVVLRGKNSLRLLKNVINDSVLKYNVLVDRFPQSKEIIKFDSCIAYSYLKNNYYEEFNDFIKDDIKCVDVMVQAMKKFHQNETLTLGIKNDKLEKELIYLIENKYIDDEFKLYFYNYPKGEYCPTLSENAFKNYMYGYMDLDIDNNKEVGDEYVRKIQKYFNDVGLKYPENILDDTYIASILFKNTDDKCMKDFLFNNLKLNTVESQNKAIETLNCLSQINIFKPIIVSYLKDVRDNIWSKSDINNETENYYVFRKIFTSYIEDDVAEFKILFQNRAKSIFYDEYKFIKNKQIVYDLINFSSFNNDLENIFPELIEVMDNKKNIELAKFWSKNVTDKNKFTVYLKKLIIEQDNYNQELLVLMKPYDILLIDDKQLQIHLNNQISVVNIDVLKKINELHILIDLNDENLNNFISNGLGMVPLINLIYYKKYDKIIGANFDFMSRFNNFISFPTLNYLNENIIGFKEYLLSLPGENRFDELFVSKYLETYPINVEWEKVYNIHLVTIMNVSNTNVIVENYKIKGFDEERLQIAINEILNLSTTNISMKYELLRTIIIDFSELVIKYKDKLHEKIERIIGTLNNSLQAELAILYQKSIKIILPEYFSVIKNYSDAEHNVLYAEFLNNLDETPTIEAIQTIREEYPYNSRIIKLLYDNGNYAKVIYSSVLKDDYEYFDQTIDQLQASQLIAIYNKNKKVKFKLLENSLFLSKIASSNLTGNITTSDIVEVLNDTTSFELLNFIVTNLSDNRILEILMQIQLIVPSKERMFIRILKTKNNLIQANEELYLHIRGILPSNYKPSFTKAIRGTREPVSE